MCYFIIGGGPPPVPLSDIDALVLDIMGEKNVTIRGTDSAADDPMSFSIYLVEECGWVN